MFAEGGIIRARAYDDHKESDVTTRQSDLSKSGWKVLNTPAQNRRCKYDNAIDDDEKTVWSTLHRDTLATVKYPQDISVDMCKMQPIIAFTYLPRRDEKVEGMVDRYIVYVSDDGKGRHDVKEGEFFNIKSNPTIQVITLLGPSNARYFKMSVLYVVSGNRVTIAEMGFSIK